MQFHINDHTQFWEIYVFVTKTLLVYFSLNVQKAYSFYLLLMVVLYFQDQIFKLYQTLLEVMKSQSLG
jgi:hypothetical protein